MSFSFVRQLQVDACSLGRWNVRRHKFSCFAPKPYTFYILLGSTFQVDLDLIVEVSRPQADTSHLVGLLWIIDRSVAVTST
jgi:hypothetical protein